MELPLVVGVDGSESSLLATDWAVDEAVRHKLPLRIVLASFWENYEKFDLGHGTARPSGQAPAERVLAAAAERARLRRPDAAVSTEVLPHDTVPALLREGRNAVALVVGSRGRGELAGLLLGSVSLTVAARAQCPVIVVRGDKAGLAGTHERILVGVGADGTSSDAVRFAFREAEARGCPLNAVRAWRCPAHETADHPLLAGEPAHSHAERASAVLDRELRAPQRDHPDVLVRRATVEGPARKVLLDRSAAADLVIIGARRRHSHWGLQLGRVGHAVLHHAQCPVAVVPQRT